MVPTGPDQYLTSAVFTAMELCVKKDSPLMILILEEIVEHWRLQSVLLMLRLEWRAFNMNITTSNAALINQVLKDQIGFKNHPCVGNMRPVGSRFNDNKTCSVMECHKSRSMHHATWNATLVNICIQDKISKGLGHLLSFIPDCRILQPPPPPLFLAKNHF